MYEIHRKIHKLQFQNKTNKLLEKAKNKADKRGVNEIFNRNETFLEVDEEQAVKDTLEVMSDKFVLGHLIMLQYCSKISYKGFQFWNNL